MPGCQEVWVGPVTDEEKDGLERWDAPALATARSVRVSDRESWIVMDRDRFEWSALNIRRFEFDVAGSFREVQRREARLRLEMLEGMGLASRFAESYDDGALEGSRSAWVSRANPFCGADGSDVVKRFGTPFDCTGPLLDSVRKIEEDHGVVVYHVIWEYRQRIGKGVELYNLLCVSQSPGNWARERGSIAGGWVDACVVNPAEDGEEVMAKIGIEVSDGCLIRRWCDDSGFAAKGVAAFAKAMLPF